MLRHLVFLVAFAATLPFMLLNGCGSSAAVPAPVAAVPAPVYLPIDGEWSFVIGNRPVFPPTGPTPQLSWAGALTSVGGVVTGIGKTTAITVNRTTPSCFEVPVSVHGTLTTAGHLSLTSDSFNGTTFSVEVDLPFNPRLAIPATTTATVAGTCSVPGSLEEATQYLPLTGTYAGALDSYDSMSKVTTRNVGTATATLVETLPDSTGGTTVSGGVHVELSTCKADFPIMYRRYGGSFSISPIQPGSLFPIELFVRADAQTVTLAPPHLGLNCKTQGFPPPSSYVEGTLQRQ